MTSLLRYRLESGFRSVLHLYWRFARATTLGVRAVVLDDAGRVFLVKHGYVSGWHLPGGGVEAGESAACALRRELREEGRIVCDEEPRLHGIFFNRRASRRDHVAVYVVRAFHQLGPPEPNWEIVASGFFDQRQLPVGTTRGTQARIAEVIDGIAPAEDWS